MRANALPANKRAAEAVVPGVGALHGPAARLALDAAEQRLLSAAPDVGRSSASPDGRFGIRVIVPLVEAEVLGAARSASCSEDHCIEGLPNEPLVVDVGAGDLGGQRHTAPVGQNMALGVAFRTIRGVRARTALHRSEGDFTT